MHLTSWLSALKTFGLLKQPARRLKRAHSDYAASLVEHLEDRALLSTFHVTSNGDNSAADNDFTQLQNAIAAAGAGDTIDIDGPLDWTAPFASAAYLASTNTAAAADIRGLAIPANIDNLTITSSNSTGHIIGLGDVTDGIYDAFAFTSEAAGIENTNLTISNLNIDNFESAVAMGWNNSGAFNGTIIQNNQVNLAGDDDGAQNIAFYLYAGQNQHVIGNTVTFQADGTNGGGINARSYGFQNATTGGTGYNGLLIDSNIFQLSATSATTPNSEIVTGVRENGHNDDNASSIAITNNSFLGRAGDDFDRGLMLTSQTTGLLIDSNVFTDVDDVFFARDASGGTDPGDQFAFTNNVLTRVGGTDGVFLQNVTTDPTPTHVIINWGINNSVDGFAGVRGLNELSIDATGASRPVSGATDLDSVNAIGAKSTIFVIAGSAGAARFTDPDGIGNGVGPAAAGFDTAATITAGIAAVDVGGTVNVAAGTYQENPVVNKSVTISGPNAGVSGGATRGAEAHVITSGNQTSVFSVTANNVTITGLEIDGDDPAVAGATLTSGADANVSYGIRATGVTGGLNVSDNIIDNAAIGFRGDGTSQGNVIDSNWFHDIGFFDFGYAVTLRTSFYADVTNNLMTEVHSGVHINDFHLAGGPATFNVSGNEIHSYAAGIWYNLQYNSGTPLTIDNDQLFAETGALANNIGILLVSIGDPDGVSITNTSVTGTDYGVVLWNDTTTSIPTLDNTDSITNTKVGVYATNNLTFNPVGTTMFGTSNAIENVNLNGVEITGSTVAAVQIEGQSGAPGVNATIQGNTQLTGGNVGLLVDGPNAAITGNTLNDTAFSGQSGNYITLSDTALDNETIDATNVTFEGQLPSALTPAQSFAVEGKIFDEIDDSSLGLIETTPGVFFVTPATAPTATDNDYTRLANIMNMISSGDTVNLSGTFDWTEPNAAASWALGNDGIAGTGDDYSLEAPANVNNVTWTSASLGSTRIQGPGDVAGVNLEGVFYFDGGDDQNWTISNLELFDFDLSIGFFFGAGGVDAFDGTTITNNHIRVPVDLNATVDPVDVNQNIGINYSFGANQTISNNIIDIDGSGVSDGANLSSSVGMQSNTSGGAVYDGLTITGNTINVTGTLSADPSLIRGFWENSQGNSSNITVSDNHFVNQTGSNAATNKMLAFIITSHSSATTTVAYTDNTVDGANIGFEWLAGQDFSGNQPVQLTGNTTTDTQIGAQIQSNGSGTLIDNSFDGVDGTSIGIDIAAGSTASLSANDISGANVGLNNSGTLTSATNNFIRNNSGDGIRINAAGTVTGTLSDNDLSGNTGLAIDNLTAAIVDASGNYFGVTAAADVAAEVSSNVDYTPWLNLGTDTDAVTAGFQGDFSALGVDSNSPQISGSRIQEAVSLLADGSLTGGARTIDVAAGTYIETDDLNIPLTLVLDGDASIATLDSDVGTTINLQGNTLTVGASSVDSTLAGTIDGTNGGLTKTGTGTLVLSGTDTYTGATTVTAGLVLLTGATTSPTTVDSGATLAGSGTIAAPVGVSSGGFLTPGDIGGLAAPGVLDTGNLTLAFGATLVAQVNGPTAGTQADEVDVTGTVDLTGSTLLTSGTITSTPGQIVTLINNDGSDAVTGTFSGLAEGSTVTINGVNFTLSYVGGTGNDVTLTQAPIVATVSDVTVNEADGTAVFTITLDQPVDIDVTIDVTFTDVSATGGGVDYTSTTQHVLFHAGDLSQQVIVPITDDSIVEGDETFTVSLGTTTPLGGRVIDFSDTGTGTITDNDSATVSITAGSDGAEGAVPTDGHFTVTLSAVSSTDTVVNYTLGGTATNGTDYSTLSGAVTIPAGQTTADIDVAVLDDTALEGTETVTATLTSLGASDPEITLDATPANLTASIDITDDDTETLLISSPTVMEGNAGTTTLTFVVTSPQAVEGGFTVAFTVADGTAGASDYTVVTTSPLTFTGAAGETQTITVNVLGDVLIEADETLTVTLGAVTPTGTIDPADIVTGAVGTGTIVNDDSATVSITKTADGVEGTVPTDGQFTVTQSGVSDTDTVITYQISGTATANSDYSSLTGTVTIPAGQTSATINVPVLNDNVVEGTETVIATLTAVVAGSPAINLDSDPANTTATVDITDDDSVAFTINNVTVSEADGTLVFDLVADHILDTDITINVTFTDVTATGGGTDYASTTQAITFLAGQTSKQVSVAINDDNIVEGTETFTAALSTTTPLGGHNVDLTDTGTGTIIDNDTATFAITDATASEGAGGLVFTVGTDKPLDIPVTITVTFTDGTATGGGTDYTSTSQQITFLPGETTKQVTVLVTDDSLLEGPETFTAALSTTTPLGGRSVVLTDTGVGTIIDNDSATASIVSVTNGAESDTPTNGKFTVSLTSVSSTDTVVNYTVSGTATAGTDYIPLSGTVTIPAGQLSADIDVLVLNDNIVEPDQTVILTLTGLGAHDPEITLDPSSVNTTASVVITDDDTDTLLISSPTVTEGNAGTTTMTFTVTSPNAVAGGFTVAFNVADLTTGGTDYTVLTNSPLTFTGTAGETQTITVNVIGDTIVEGTETLQVTLGQIGGVSPEVAPRIITGAIGTGTITNDDTDTLLIGSPSVVEGNTGTTTMTFTVTSPNAVQGGFTVPFVVTGVTANGTDYTVVTNSPLTFTGVAGETQTITVNVNGDTTLEPDETLTVTLGAAVPVAPVTAASIVSGEVGTGTIVNDDTSIVTITKISDGAEGATPTNGTFRVSLSTASATDTVVTYSVGGTATPGAGQDYTPLTGTVTIPAGQLSADINVNVVNDSIPEDPETVIVTLTGLGAHDPLVSLSTTPASLTATLTITDDDLPIITSPASASVPENTPVTTVVLDVNATPIAGHTLTYSLSGPDAARFHIDPTTGEITFASSPDFEAPTDQGGDNVYNVTVNVSADFNPARITTQDLTITVTPVNDNDPVFSNASPTFTITANSTAGTTVGTVSATDNDLPAQTLTYSIVSGNESGAFAINPATGEITVADSTALGSSATNSFTLDIRATDNGNPARSADAIAVVNVTNVLHGPTITIPNTPINYQLCTKPVAIAADGTFTDTDSTDPDFSAAKLTVSIVAGRGKRDRLKIARNGDSIGQIHTKGRKVFAGDVQIGTVSGGHGNRNPNLVVTLNGAASTAAVNSLLERVTFQAKAGAGTTRTVSMQVSNVSGLDSNVATRDITVTPMH